MNIFLYIIIFIMGTVFGSFYTLAVYRIPKRIDIIKTHSFCPNCGHKLGFFELIPVWSYLFLGGKCKKCKQKIRPRYFILEILSGLAFVLLAISLKIDVYNLEISNLISFAFIVLYFVAVFLIAGIDKEYRKIDRYVLYYGVIMSCMYIIYLCIMAKTSIYRYVMYLVTLIILLIIDNIKQLKQAKDSYLVSLLILIIVMSIYAGWIVTLCSIIALFLIIAIIKILFKLKNYLNKIKKNNKEYKFKYGFLLVIINVLFFICNLFYTLWL